MKTTARVPSWADRLYGALLRTYPAPFREEYAGEMRAMFRSRWREERASRGVPGVTRLWLGLFLDTLRTAGREHGEMLGRDLRYAWRSLTSRPSWAFTAAALLTLALGIGAVTAIFTIVHAVLLAPLPYHGADRVVRGLARQLWPHGEDPVGRRVQLGNKQVFTIVGVVGDVRQLSLAEDPTPTMYISTSWFLWPTMTLVVRTQDEPTALAQEVRQTVTRLDPHQPVSDFQTMRTAVAGNAAAPRLNTVLVASFAVLALLLAVVGVAGVVGYGVGQRTREIAVRLALGSTPGRAVRHVLRGGLLMCATGILLGIGAALALGRALSSVLYGVGAYDPATFVVTTAVLFAIAILACWLPAQRVTRIEPSLTLRDG